MDWRLVPVWRLLVHEVDWCLEAGSCLEAAGPLGGLVSRSWYLSGGCWSMRWAGICLEAVGPRGELEAGICLEAVCPRGGLLSGGWYMSGGCWATRWTGV